MTSDTNKPPVKLILASGRLTDELIKLLMEHFGFEAEALAKTVYKRIRFHKSAITMFNYVFYDTKCFKKSETEWLLLIIHEQVHRQEIGNNLLKAIGWYFGYLSGYIKSGFSYRKNPYEARAYDIEASAARLIQSINL
jgi:hypothetical protein